MTSVIDHVGAKIVLVDTDENLGLNIQQLEEKINENTKAIIPVDIAGRINDYAKIKEIVKKKKNCLNLIMKLQIILEE